MPESNPGQTVYELYELRFREHSYNDAAQIVPILVAAEFLSTRLQAEFDKLRTALAARDRQ